MYRFDCSCGERVTFADDSFDAPVCFSCGSQMRRIHDHTDPLATDDLTDEQRDIERLMRGAPGSRD